MAQSATIYRVLVASPSDCVHERKAIPEVVALWNALNSLRTAAILEPVLWETHARPELGDRPQAIINKQLVIQCDILVGAFWTRLGTHTGAAESGTVEEIEAFRAAGKPVLLYFSAAPVVMDSVDQEQYRRLTEYRDRIRGEGIVFSYDSIGEFRELLLRHLTNTVADLHAMTSESSDVESDVDESDKAKQLRIFRESLGAFVRRLEAEWSSERDSQPYSTDEGRSIMTGARFEVLNFRSQIIRDGSGNLTKALDEALKRLRELEKHQLYIDGGISFRKFWELGDQVVDALKNAQRIAEAEW